MTTIDKLEVEISTDATKLQTGMTQASQSVSTFTDRVSKSATTLQGFGSVGMQAMGVMDRYQLSTLSVENAMTSLQDAQMRYNMALSQFGKDSQQAVFALSGLTRAANQYEAAQTQANLSLAMMGLTMFGMIPQILKFGSTAVTTLKNVEVAALLTSARIKAMAPELLILSAIVGGTYYLWTQRTQETQSATERLTTSVDTSKLSVMQLREEINKLTGEIEDLSKPPKRGPQSMMERFLEYHATGVLQPSPEEIEKIARQTEIEKRTVEIERIRDVLDVVGPSLGMQKPGVISPPTGWGMTEAGYKPPPGFKQTEENMREISDSIKKIADEPKTLNVSININKIETYEDPSEVARSMGESLAAGYNYTKYKPR